MAPTLLLSLLSSGAGSAVSAFSNSPELRRAALVAGVGVAGVIAIRHGKSWFDDKKADRASDHIGEDSKRGKATEFAERIYKGIVLTNEWWNDNIGDGTNEEMIFRAAAESKEAGIEWKEIKDQYGKLHPGRNMTDDLRADLDSDEYDSLIGLVSGRITLMELGL